MCVNNHLGQFLKSHTPDLPRYLKTYQGTFGLTKVPLDFMHIHGTIHRMSAVSQGHMEPIRGHTCLSVPVTEGRRTCPTVCQGHGHAHDAVDSTRSLTHHILS